MTKNRWPVATRHSRKVGVRSPHTDGRVPTETPCPSISRTEGSPTRPPSGRWPQVELSCRVREHIYRSPTEACPLQQPAFRRECVKEMRAEAFVMASHVILYQTMMSFKEEPGTNPSAGATDTEQRSRYHYHNCSPSQSSSPMTSPDDRQGAPELPRMPRNRKVVVQAGVPIGNPITLIHSWAVGRCSPESAPEPGRPSPPP